MPRLVQLGMDSIFSIAEVGLINFGLKVREIFGDQNRPEPRIYA